ncbi:unnamed protein product [Hermetia illucens]|uniref:Uncharacterized protein n=1 Tax=Hermetia illucens TaxID=343691 RepID=A0A7R8V3T6_HERIL|nr:uncharacterized protein LOC119658474 isoform X2 [Hermetia illucens]CAD7091680.1 unnamed protein product [Hermetia illucens]
MIYASCSHTERAKISEESRPVWSRIGSNYTTNLIATGETVFGGCSSSATNIKNNKTGFHNSKLHTRTTTLQWLFFIVILYATLTEMLPEVDAVPLAGATSRSLSQCRSADCDTAHNRPKAKPGVAQSFACKKRLIKRTDANLKICTPERVRQLFPDSVPWQNPCSANAYDDHAVIEKRHLNLDPLKRHLKNMLITKYGSCNNSDKTDWCHKSQQYSFFEHSRRTDKLCLRLEHKRLQVYVAGLSYLNRLNENANLTTIVQNAKTLLCEIETAINQTACIKPPSPLSPREMCLRLNLQSLHETEEQTGVDVIFAKANFGKYLRGLNRTLASQRQPNVCGRPKLSGNRRRISADSSGRITSSIDSSASNTSNQSKPRRRKNRLRISAKPALNARNRGRAGQRGAHVE